MSRTNEQHQDLPAVAFDELRHDLLNPLATIRGRAQLLIRAVERSISLEDDERARLLRGLAAIDQAVLTLVEVLDRAEACQDRPPAIQDS